MVRLEGFLGEEVDQPDQGHGEGVEGKEGEELSVHVDPVDTSVLCHDTARPLPLPLNTYNLGKPDLAKRFQPPADKVIECPPLIIVYVTRISLLDCPQIDLRILLILEFLLVPWTYVYAEYFLG